MCTAAYFPLRFQVASGGLRVHRSTTAVLRETSLDGFAALEPIDVHTHDFANDPSFYQWMERLHLHVLDICVADSYNIFRSLGPELTAAKHFVGGSGGRAKLCTTFDPFAFEDTDFAKRTILHMNRDFAEGAVAVKIWKNIGMQLKRSNRSYVMPDDPVFQPIYENIVAQNKTLVAHLAEPDSCWQPPNPASPDYGYYKENPQWYMYLQPDRPSKPEILAARDRLLEKNPKLRVIGAHLGSMETNVDEIAKRLDRYPNFAVDTAARMEYLIIQPREKVRQFLIKYQDRILYGTDMEFQTDQPTAQTIQDWERAYQRDWTYLATDKTWFEGDLQVKGLALPHEVLQKIFRDNAVHWIPGILGP